MYDFLWFLVDAQWFKVDPLPRPNSHFWNGAHYKYGDADGEGRGYGGYAYGGHGYGGYAYGGHGYGDGFGYGYGYNGERYA